jgi:hypothetical protein
MNFLTQFMLLLLNVVIVMSNQIKGSGGNIIVCPAGKYNLYFENLLNNGNISSRRRRKRFTLICAECKEGRFMDASEHAFFACKACPSGQYQPDKGMASCLGQSCPAGKFGPIAQTTLENVSCKDCATGQYTSAAGLGPECFKCEPGRYQADTGGLNCEGTLCISGKYGHEGASHRSNALCFDCAVGQFSDHVGESECTMCPGGKYQTIEGQTDCVDQPSCKGMSEYFNKKVYACTLTNSNFSWLIPMGIAFTVTQALLVCCAGYCIICVNCIISFALTLHYGLGDYTGAHSDSTIWCLTTYYIISMIWSLAMLWRSTKSRKLGDETKCCPFY